MSNALRSIIHRTRGHAGGPITRLASPSDLGELIKPFIFLDRFAFDGKRGPSIDDGWHPHSGIATVTVVFDGSVRYAETTGNAGVVPAGGIEYMQAGGGVWHTGTTETGPVRGFQLWIALPPALETTPSASHYVMPADVPMVGPARVILGAYEGAASPIAAPPMTYLAVSLAAGERWSYAPAPGHDVAWVALLDGALVAPSAIAGGELAIFAPGNSALAFEAAAPTRFVIGSATRHPHDLVLGNYSVHTSVDALHRGETEIRRLGAELRARGKQSYALGMY